MELRFAALRQIGEIEPYQASIWGILYCLRELFYVRPPSGFEAYLRSVKMPLGVSVIKGLDMRSRRSFDVQKKVIIC